MKSYPRLSPYKTENDPLSAFLSEFRFDVEYFTNWPQQDHKTLRNIVGSQMKLVLLESGHSTLFADKKKLRHVRRQLLVHSAVHGIRCGNL